MTTEVLTGSTKAPETPLKAVTTVTPEPSPRFVVNNSDGEPCMLLNFDATMKVKYETTDGGWLESTLPMTNTSSFEGSCANNSLRSFTLYYPSEDTFCAILTLFFNVTSNTTYYNRNGLSVRYIEPCVQQNAKKYNTIDNGYFPYHSYDGTIGKSFRCESILNKAKYFNVTLDNILIQPFAQKSEDKGHFGEVETCKEPVLTTKNPIVTSPHPTAKPSPNKAGMIAGIVIGVLVAVAIVIGIAVYVVRKRRMAKNVSYGNL
ncbi:uncharacterized protein LOC119725407 [Patiria miniata]|uniref:Lysosome-associated membrane glycoprotein 5 n=1 Tax=Patiria miniata TaxID=46514 RepID=A0A913ZNQ1_PATMI|nr:uncharacterized protein LOC119725407 [Patiria miniata]